MKKKFRLMVIALISLSPWAVMAQSLDQDPSVRVGKLKNGLTYYIRHNAKEAGLADFYIAQKVGSILEEPRQRGLAHFLEHMAFNGTKHFPGKGKQLGIVPWCETIGVKFGANLNAYTSIDETVYHIGSAPIKREGIIDSCLLVLNDWSHYILLEDKEIDKERGVIHEEWRTRRAGKAVSRMMEDATPQLYKGTKYEDCMPIGNMDVVDHFAYQDLRDYYQKWYRPDLQAIVVVGDFDVDQMETKIKRLFSKIPAVKNPAKREYYQVNDNDKMIVSIQKDKEQPIILAHLYMKLPATPFSEKNNVKYLRDNYISWLVAQMLNGRLAEVRQQANPPFLSATSHIGTFFVSRTKDAFSLSISCKQDNILGGIRKALATVEAARQHGFTASELERAKTLYKTRTERAVKSEKDRTNSHFVNKCVQNFLYGEPLITAKYEDELSDKLNQEVTLEEVNQELKKLITHQNQAFVVYAPENPSIVIPSEAEFEKTILDAQAQSYEAYQEEKVDAELTPNMPQAGKIIAEKDFGKYGVREITLSNGLKVYVKPTDYQSDQVLFSLEGWGGTSLFPDRDIPNLSLITSAVTAGGVGNFDATALRKALTGKAVRIQPSVGDTRQNISGNSSVKDMKTMLQLAYLYFTSPRRDTVAYQSLINRTKSFLTNRSASPKVAFNDSVTAALYNNHPRTRPVVADTLDKANYDRILKLYKFAFSDASKFRATIIGKVNLDSLRPLLTQYLATLPVKKHCGKCTHQHDSINYARVPQYSTENKVVKFNKKMATPLANVSIFYTAQLPFTPKNDLLLDVFTRTLQIAYTDSVREEKGGTYHVGVSFDLDKRQNPDAVIRISYNADPNRYDELNPIIYQQIANIAQHGPVSSSLAKVKEYLKKQYAQMDITNDYWSYVIWHQLRDGEDFDKDYVKMVDEISPADIQKLAADILRQNHRIEVTMLSAK